MSVKSNVVLGEAPESDDEEYNVDSSTIKKIVEKYRGILVDGEASEWDDESNADSGSVESVSSAVSASSVLSLVGDKVSKKSSSLLVKKLRSDEHNQFVMHSRYSKYISENNQITDKGERNVSLQKNIKEFVSHTIVSASNELNSTNQQLLKCQVQLQEAADIFKTIKSSITHLDNNLESLLCTPFLPYITLSDNSKQANSPLT